MHWKIKEKKYNYIHNNKNDKRIIIYLLSLKIDYYRFYEIKIKNESTTTATYTK